MTLRDVAGSIYDNTIRSRLPRKAGNADGVAVLKPRLLDIDTEVPDHEIPLREAIREHVKGGDTVVLIGAGHGVSTVEAARGAGRSGRVFAFEASPELASQATKTIRLNDVEEIASVATAAVGEVRSHYGDTVSEVVVSPKDLPHSDVLIMDCEGAEMEVLDGMEWQPRVIVVETHGVFDSPTDEVTARLDEMGYKVASREPEKEEEDVFILAAIRQ